MLTARTINGSVTVALCEIRRFGVTAAMSEEDWVAFRVAVTDFAGEYTPGASTAVTVAAPRAAGVSQVVALPL